MNEVEALHDPVCALMRTVGREVLLKHFRSLADGDVIEKSPGDVVTVADHEAERRLVEGLADILPAASMVGEEAVEADPSILERLGDPLCWIVDPLDGTNNFAAGKPPFGILIALTRGGETIGGWLYDPLTERMCHAFAGGGAFVNGERVEARPTGGERPVAAISLLFLDPARRAEVKARCAGHYDMVDIPRCAAEQYPRLVLGENDISIFERVLAWDHAAGILFLNEAGGVAQRPDGRPYRVTQHEQGLIAASSPALWEDAAMRLG